MPCCYHELGQSAVLLTHGRVVMGEGRTSEFYQRISPQDQIQFGRWLKANAVMASIFWAAVAAMALVSAQNSGPADASAARIGTGSKGELLATDRTNWGKAYRRVHEARERPMPNDQ